MYSYLQISVGYDADIDNIWLCVEMGVVREISRPCGQENAKN